MDIYSQYFLDHAKKPRNVGELAKPTHSGSMVNTSCGDICKVELGIRNQELCEIKHKTQGCMVSVFSASVLSEKLIGKSAEEVLKMTPDEMLKLLGIELSISRIKCAVLALMTIQKALKK